MSASHDKRIVDATQMCGLRFELRDPSDESSANLNRLV